MYDRPGKKVKRRMLCLRTEWLSVLPLFTRDSRLQETAQHLQLFRLLPRRNGNLNLEARLQRRLGAAANVQVISRIIGRQRGTNARESRLLV